MTRLIDKDDLISFLERVFPDNVIEGITSTTLFKQIIQDIRCQPIVMPEERPQGNCKNCKAYRQYGSRADGYCGIPRMTSEGEQYINVNGNFYCSYYKETDNEEKDNI